MTGLAIPKFGIRLSQTLSIRSPRSAEARPACRIGYFDKAMDALSLLSARSMAPQGLLFALCFATDFG